jgi:transcription initiation factor TFIID subunit 1
VPKVKIPHPHVKKSKILLGKAGVINVLQEDTPPPPPKSPDRDPFNISNDVYYMAKSSEATLRLKVGGGNLIQHSTPVVELRAPFIPVSNGRFGEFLKNIGLEQKQKSLKHVIDCKYCF